jgi:NRAMP (natural resistance-associated macrophage protein)-like metal ion transporter
MSSKFIRLLKSIGPGLITGASDDDPSGIATYSQAGAQFGLMTLWTAFITFPLMAAIQEMCARIGIVTSQGLITNINKNYPKPLVYIVILIMTVAIVLNIGADISSMGAVANLLFPVIPAFLYSIIFTLFLIFMMIKLSYVKVATFLKYLCTTLILYVLVPFFIHKDWLNILKHTFIPHIQFNKEFIGILVAILGTTISPYLFFWQATMEAEEKRHKKLIINKKAINNMIVDVDLGMFFSNIIMYFIILTTGIVLFSSNNHEITTVKQAARALEPVAGKLCYLFFSLGIISTGMLAIPVLSGSLSYIFTSTFHCKEGLDKKFHEAKSFYIVMIISLLLGLIINFIGINPIKALLYSAILYGILAPILILIILFISNNKKIMGKFTNGIVSNIFGGIAFVFMTISAIAYFILY